MNEWACCLDTNRPFQTLPRSAPLTSPKRMQGSPPMCFLEVAARFGNLHLGLCGITHSVPSVGGSSVMREAHSSAHPVQAFPAPRGHSLSNARATRRVSGSHVADVSISCPYTCSQGTRDKAGLMRKGEEQVAFPGRGSIFPKLVTRLLGRFWEYRAFLQESSQAFGWRQRPSVNC